MESHTLSHRLHCGGCLVQVFSVNEAVPGRAGLLSSTHHNGVPPPAFSWKALLPHAHEMHFTPLAPELKGLHKVALNVLSRPLARHTLSPCLGLSALHTLPFPASLCMPPKLYWEAFLHSFGPCSLTAKTLNIRVAHSSFCFADFPYDSSIPAFLFLFLLYPTTLIIWLSS